MHNPYEDEFATTLADLVEGGAVPLATTQVSVPNERSWTLALNGVKSSSQWIKAPENSVPLSLRFELLLEPGRTYALGWTYRLSPLVQVNTVALKHLSGIALEPMPFDFVTRLQARHGRAFGFCLFRTGAAAPAASATVSLDLLVARAPDAKPHTSSIVDLDLSRFVLYKLIDYDTSAQCTINGQTRTLKLASKGVELYDGRHLQEADKLNDLTAGTYDLDIVLSPRQAAGRPVHFLGRVEVGSSLALVIEFPLLAPDDAPCNWSILPYLANLAHYGYPAGTGRRRVLSYAERLALDTRNPRLYSGGGDAPLPLVLPRPVFRWTQRLLHMQAFTQAELGGVEKVNAAPLLRLCQEQGVSLIFADTDGIGPASYQALKSYDLMRVITSFHWEDAMKVVGEGSGADPSGLVAVAPPDQPRSSNLFKNPMEFDTAVLTASARRFAQAHPSIAAVDLPRAGELLISLPEMGDTWAPLPFLLPASGLDAARRKALLDELDTFSFRMAPRDSRVKHPLSPPVGFRLQADATYHQAYWLSLSDEYDARARYWNHESQTFAQSALIPSAMRGLAQAFLDNLHDLTSVFCSPATTTALTSGSGIFHNVAPDYSRFSDVTPGNGPHDLCEYGTASLPSRPISERRALALTTAAGRVQWYCQFRHWVRTNIAYVEAAAGAAKQALHGAPHLIFTSLSKPFGYWGFESYHTVRSGSLDIVWFHDDFGRGAGATAKHLIFNGVWADFARALSRLPNADESPFSPARRPLGAYLSNERVDIKAMVWASRGGRYFECCFSSDAYSVDPAWGNAGDLAYQPLAQGRSVAKVLRAQQSFFDRAERVSTPIAMMVPQTASIWSIDDGGLKGFAAPELLEGDFYGQHAMFTHAQLPVDLVFEEGIVDSLLAAAPVLGRYDVLCIGTAFLRDDVFHAVATWVMAGGILVLSSGSVKAEVSEDGAATVRFNEFAQDRQAPRNEWLTHGELLASQDSGATLRRAGLGCVIDLGSQRWGIKYIEALGMVFDYMLPAAQLSTTGAATRHREAFIGLIDQARALRSSPQGPLADQRSAWVTAAPASVDLTPPVVEVVDLRLVGDNPAVLGPQTQGAVVIINHRHRDYERAKWRKGQTQPFAPLDPATADIPRETTAVTLHLKGMGPKVGITLAPSRTASAQKIARDPDGILRFTFELGDYAVVGWQRGS